MRHTLAVRGSNKIKNGELTYHLPSLQDGECVKLSQNGKHIYLIYRLTESMSLKQAEVNEHILVLNDLDSDSSATVEQFHPRAAQHLKVEVSELDWKIININQAKIAQSFLEQISVVWPNAQIPIYYDQINFVVLKALCENVLRLSINTTVEFIERKEVKEQEKQQSEQEKEPFSCELVLSTQEHNIRSGYFNCISINTSFKEKLKDLQHYWIVQNTLQFSQLPAINDLLKAEQQRTKKDQSFVPPSNKRLVYVFFDSNVKENEFSCSQQCRKLLGLSQKILISDHQHFKPTIQNISLDIFLNDPDLSISISQLKQDTLSLPESVQVQLAHHIVNILFNKKQFYILQKQYPYLFKESLYIVTLTHRTNSKVNEKLHRLAFIGKESADKRQDYYKKFENKINYQIERKSQISPAYLYQRYELISRWIKVIQQNERTNSLQGSQLDRKNIGLIFSVIYAEEINKVIQFISSQSPQSICVVCSYGSNGKSYLHNFLQINGHRMWKINFRELNNPSLSFKEIDFYLEWVFANTPYNTIYFDDFDSLCAKIDDGDQLRKQQKRISKLILRKINLFAKIYNRKLLLTAKNDTNLDEELAKHITVTLKNPSRELRLKALVQISKKSSDSPIKLIQSEEEKIQIEKNTKNSSRKLEEIVDATQSLTFGTFTKHAIGFTKPKNVISTQVYDFSKIAGLKIAKSTIQNIIEKPIKYSFLFKTVPIKLPRGILLYGATGNGKSALGLAVKDQFKMKYFSVKGSDILSKYIGGSEAAVRDIFEKALSVSPSIIFFDQFESIVPKRSANNTGVNDRIVNQFLCYLDGVSAISGVYIIAASSRPDLIDAAVLRPGRLDAHLFLDYPQAEERQQLIHLFQKSIKIEADEEEIIEKTENYSYSDLIGLFKELRIKRSAEVLKNENYKSSDFINIGRQLFEQTLKNFKLSVPPQEQQRQRKNYLNFKQGVGPDMKTQKQVQF